MGVGRLAPHRVRAKYTRALAEIPLPVRSFTGIDPSALQTIAETAIAGNRVEFRILAGTPRLWVLLPDSLPQVIGYLTGLDCTAEGGAPEFHVTETDHLEWARHTGRAARIKREALAAWQAAQRECEG
jgi:hypothetical protein